MCTEEFIIITNILFILANIGLCLYMYRIHASFRPPSKKYVCLTIIVIFMIGTLLGFHVESDCNRYFLTWGSVTFALYLCLLIMEMSSYIFTH